MGLDFDPHAHPIPREKPVGIPTESSYPQNHEIFRTHTAQCTYITLCFFRLMHFLAVKVLCMSMCLQAYVQ